MVSSLDAYSEEAAPSLESALVSVDRIAAPLERRCLSLVVSLCCGVS